MGTIGARRPRGFLARAAAAAFAVATLAAGGGPALAQLDFTDVQALRAQTPSCEANPGAPWVGRVAGSYDDILDRPRMLSLVGCFPDEATCNAWKQRVSGRIPGPLVQYSCSRRH